MPRQQPLCTKTITPKWFLDMSASERERQTRGWVIEKTKEDIATLGYQDVLLKGDGETALAQVLEDVELAREAPSIIQHSPAYDPQGNGVADKAA